MTRTTVLLATITLFVVAMCASPVASADTVVTSAVADTYFQQLSPTSNFATATYLRAGYDYSNYMQRSLFQFDLPSLDAGMAVDSVVLKLYLNWQETGGTQGNTRIFRLSSSWTETGATWRSRDGINEWSTYGGDFDPTAIYVGPPSRNAVVGWYSFNVTDTVKGWYEGTYANNGIAVDSVGNFVYWASREFESGARSAKLEITTSIVPEPSSLMGLIMLGGGTVPFMLRLRRRG